jgi:hypothetical protein
MKGFIKSKKGLALLATLVVAAAAAIGAYAYFSSSGTAGNATATVGQSTAFTFTITDATGGPMYPGDTSAVESETYQVNNPSTGAQKLNQVVISVANSDGTPWYSSTTNYPTEDACDASDFELSLDGSTWASAGDSVTDTLIGTDLAGGTSSATHTVYIRMVDSGDGQDNCQNLTNVPLYYAAS